MNNYQIPELLERSDFLSPLLYKVYKYLRIIYRNGLSNYPINSYFNEKELKNIIDTLRKCDVDFNEKYDSGYCENTSLRSTYNLQNRIDRTFQPYYTRKMLNSAEKYINSSKKATKGELDVLECIFYGYAEKVFYPNNDSELAYVDELGLNRSFKKKELQLAMINSLFCNMGNRIQVRRDNTAKELLAKYDTI